VVDDGEACDTNTVAISVLTANQAVKRLISAIDRAEVRKQRPLVATLSAALASLECGRSQSAINQLHAFQNKVRAQVSDPGVSMRLIADAGRVITAFEEEAAGTSDCRLRLSDLRSSHCVQLQLCAPPSRVYAIEVSTNLVDWQPIGMICSDAAGLGEFEEGNTHGGGCRFYRAVEAR
jgi:hypothetical protein